MRGRIVKGIGGFYYVSDGEKLYECRARGKFRLDEIKPLAGDVVEFDNGCLMEILPRKNALLRPPCCNVDQFVVVLSASRPEPDLLLADKLLIQAGLQCVNALIVLNKCDEAKEGVLDALTVEYREFSDIFIKTSAVTGEGLSELKGRLKGKLSCFAGQSAVGKSSILNALCTRFELETGGLSRKTGRGRHTTRAAELLDMDAEGFVLDTPGFSLLEIDGIEPEELDGLYPEFAPYLGRCRFTRCAHDAEPDCAVKDAVDRCDISRGRYDRYIALLQEARQKRRKRYD